MYIQLLACKIAFTVVAVLSVAVVMFLTAWLGVGRAVITQGTVKR